MAVVYTKKDQGNSVTTGTGAPVHSAVAGDRYTDTANGNTYQYTTSWQTVSYSAGVNIYNANGTLIGARTVNLAGYGLTFSDSLGTGSFTALIDDNAGSYGQLSVGVGQIFLETVSSLSGTGKYLSITPTAINVAGYYNLPTSASPSLNQIVYASSTSQLDFTSVKTINGNSILGSGNLVIGGGSGIVGIANASGVYTYYATLSLAITAAVSGQTVDLLTDITETGSVTLSMKAGVKINGNGYTYTLSVNDDTHAIVNGTSLSIELFNLKVVRTGRANNLGGLVFVKNDTGSTLHLKCQNVVFENTYGVAVRTNVAIIYGLTVNAYGEGVTAPYDFTGLNNCIITSSTSYGVNLPFSGFDIINCTVTGSTYGILTSGTVYNSIGRTTSGGGIQAPRVVDSTGTSSSGTGVVATNGYNCVGISTSGIGLSGTFTNSTGISTSGYGGTNGIKTNCTLISSSNYGSFQESLNNCFLQSTTNVPLWLSTGKLVNSCTALCLWDNVGGHAINTTAAATGVDIRNCNLTVTNASAYCINGASASTFKYASNTYKGSTTAVNTTNITQGITNTSDNQGNILI